MNDSPAPERPCRRVSLLSRLGAMPAPILRAPLLRAPSLLRSKSSTIPDQSAEDTTSTTIDPAVLTQPVLSTTATSDHAQPALAQPDHNEIVKISAQKPPSMSRPQKRWRLACLLLMLPLAIIGGIWLRLRQGPINLEIVRPFIVQMAQDRLGGRYRASAQTVGLEADQGSVYLAFRGLDLTTSDNQKVLSAPHARISFDASSLIRGAPRPSSVDIDDLQIHLRVRPGGGVSISATDSPAVEAAPLVSPNPDPVNNRVEPQQPLSSSGDTAAAPILPPTTPNVHDPSVALVTGGRAQILREIGRSLNSMFDMANGSNSPIAELEHFGVDGGRLVIDDETVGQTRAFRNFHFAMDRHDNALIMSAAADGSLGRWRLSAATTGARKDEHSLEFHAEGLSVDELALAAGRRSSPIDSDCPIAFTAKADFAADGHMRMADIRLWLDAGFYRFDDPDFEPVFIDHAGIDAHWDGERHIAVIDQAYYADATTHVALNGEMSPPSAANDTWTLQLGLKEPSTLSGERANEPAQAITALNIDILGSMATRRVNLRKVEVRGPMLNLALSGSIDCGVENAPLLRLGLSASQTGLRNLLTLWPGFIAAPTRAWIADRASGALFATLNATTDIDGQDLRIMRAQKLPANERVQGDYALSDGVVTLMPDSPVLSGVAAKGQFSMRTMRMDVSAAHVDAQNGTKIEFSNTHIVMPGLNITPPPLSVSAQFVGSAPAIIETLSRPSFSTWIKTPIEASAVKGRVAGAFTLDTKIWSTMEEAKKTPPAIKLDAKIDDFSLDKVLGKERFEQGTLTLAFDKNNLKLNGTGRILGAQAALDVRYDVAEQNGEGTLSFPLDDAMRSRLNMPSAPMVTGPIGVRLSAPLGEKGATPEIELDLTKTAIDQLVPGFYKPAGRAAKASMLYRKEENGATLDDLNYEGGGALVKGMAQINAEGALMSAKLSQFKLSPGDDMRIEATRTPEGLKIQARGAALDARPFIQSMQSISAGDERARVDRSNLELDLKSSIVSGHNRQVITNAELKLTRRAGSIRALQFIGKFGADSLSARIKSDESNHQRMQILSEDAGSLLAFFDIYNHMEGGAMSLSMMSRDNATQVGTLDIQDFILRGEPAMRSFATATPHEAYPNSPRLDPAIVSFARLHADLVKNDSRIYISNGVVSSANIGTTLDGWIDMSHGVLDVNGTFIPAYTVNNFFGKIPLFGALLGGGTHEGLFGLNYRVSGPIRTPSLNINPLSAIAPGFLRKVFGALPPP